MSETIQAILIGAGQRGSEAYAPYALRHPEELCFIAVAEPVAERRNRFANQYHIPIENTYETWEPLLSRPKLAQAVLVCTQDQQHASPALAALRAGYDVLLEKPMATTQEDCLELVKTAEEYGRQLHICHVMRYTPHFQKMREIIQSGELGQIVNVSHRENVSYWHMAHSFVRGNWANSTKSSPMILAKCCHDFDILTWVLGRSCEWLSSTGSLIHFRPGNAPPGAPEYCLDGRPSSQTCPYYAPFIYLNLTPLWRSFVATSSGLPRWVVQLHQGAPWLVKAMSTFIPLLRQVSDYHGWPRSVVTNESSPEIILDAIRKSPYGRCVYRCDNNVVDHQVVLMQFEGNISVTLTMHGHSHIEYRITRIEGSQATLFGEFGLGGAWLEVRYHRSGKRMRIRTSGEIGQGHGGGDEALMAGFVHSLLTGGSQALTLGRQSLESHLLAFAAEKARLEGRIVQRNELAL
jgi:predicted dehydrogenase